MPNSKDLGFHGCQFFRLEAFIFNSNWKQRLGTCQGWNSFTLVYWNRRFGMCGLHTSCCMGGRRRPCLSRKRTNTNYYNFGCNGCWSLMFSWRTTCVFHPQRHIQASIVWHSSNFLPPHIFRNEGPLAVYPTSSISNLKGLNIITLEPAYIYIYIYTTWMSCSWTSIPMLIYIGS